MGDVGAGEVLAVLVLVLLLAAVAAALVLPRRARRRREALQERFGPEYDRAVQRSGRRDAERDLAQRERRYGGLDLHDLPREAQEGLAERWRRAQSGFVTDPRATVEAAEELVGEAMRERGYPDGDAEERAAALSVDFPDAAERFRQGHALAEAGRRGEATTEELRQAVLHLRAVVGALLGGSAGEHGVGEHGVGEHGVGEHGVGEHESGAREPRTDGEPSGDGEQPPGDPERERAT